MAKNKEKQTVKPEMSLQEINISSPGGNIDSYLNSIHKIGILSPEEERKLAEDLYYRNDLDAARILAKFCSNTPCKVNLIEYNKVDGLNFEKSSKENTENFIKFLEGRNIIVNLRRSKGKDIDAACGQLINKLS